MDEVIHKAQICYQQNRPKGDISKKWNDKKGNKFVSNHRGNKGSSNEGICKGQNSRNFNKNQHRFKMSGEFETQEQPSKSRVELASRPPM